MFLIKELMIIQLLYQTRLQTIENKADKNVHLNENRRTKQQKQRLKPYQYKLISQRTDLASAISVCSRNDVKYFQQLNFRVLIGRPSIVFVKANA